MSCDQLELSFNELPHRLYSRYQPTCAARGCQHPAGKHRAASSRGQRRNPHFFSARRKGCLYRNLRGNLALRFQANSTPSEVLKSTFRSDVTGRVSGNDLPMNRRSCRRSLCPMHAPGSWLPVSTWKGQPRSSSTSDSGSPVTVMVCGLLRHSPGSPQVLNPTRDVEWVRRHRLPEIRPVRSRLATHHDSGSTSTNSSLSLVCFTSKPESDTSFGCHRRPSP